MKKTNTRLDFIRNTASAIAGLALFSGIPKSLFAEETSLHTGMHMKPGTAASIRFSVIGINHPHINSIVDLLTKSGGVFDSFFAAEDDLAIEFAKKYPSAKRARTAKEIYENKSVQLITSAAIPNERAAIGIAAMQHNKDFLVDKPGITTLEQLAEIKRVQKISGKIFSVMYGRYENRGSLKAGELVHAGAIGKVIQTIAFAPHRINPSSRPGWFWDTNYYGGIINDIGSHQFDEFLFFTGSTTADIVAAQVANVHHPSTPAFEDFGDAMVTGNKGTGYMRLDWFTPGGLKSWGDDRITILGTDGYIEVRKNIDIAGRDGGHHLLLVDQKQTSYIDCSNYPLQFGTRFIDDIINRTNTSMNQDQCFLATELALKAQLQAKKIQIG